jgi:polysaccharide export outer membrane protein
MQFLARWALVVVLLCGVSLAWSANSLSPEQQPSDSGASSGGGMAAMPLTPGAGSGSVAVSTSDYVIGPSDLLEIDVFQVDELSGTERVNSSGYIKMPLIGSVKVAGLSREQAEDLIAALYSVEYLQDPQVNIDIAEYVSHQITVLGSVAVPGVYPLKGKTTLLQALAMAGGAGQLADQEQIVVFRTDKAGAVIGYVVNMEQILAGTKVDPEIIGNDKIVVPESGSKSFIKGVSDTLRGFIGFRPY